MTNPAFLYMRKLCSFRYTHRIMPLLVKSKFQASSYILWLHSQVCIKPGQKPQRPVSHTRKTMLLTKRVMLLTSVFKLLVSLLSNNDRGAK